METESGFYYFDGGEQIDYGSYGGITADEARLTSKETLCQRAAFLFFCPGCCSCMLPLRRWDVQCTRLSSSSYSSRSVTILSADNGGCKKGGECKGRGKGKVEAQGTGNKQLGWCHRARDPISKGSWARASMHKVRRFFLVLSVCLPSDGPISLFLFNCRSLSKQKNQMRHLPPCLCILAPPHPTL